MLTSFPAIYIFWIEWGIAYP